MYLTRHSDMIKEINLEQKIVVAGAGSVGSYAVLALSKLGFSNIMVFDDGIVEEENIAPQFYRPRDIGKFKVNCLKEAIKQQTGFEIIACETRLGANTAHLIGDKGKQCVLVLAVDTMEARKHIFTEVYHQYAIDARMAIEFLTIISYDATTNAGANYYRKTLFTDADAVPEACTNKAISYTSFIAGGLVAKTVVDIMKGNYLHRTVNFDINNFDLIKL